MNRYLLIWTFSLFISMSVFAQKKQQQPNILLILADDLGWYDLGCYGSNFYETPTLDKLAAKGIRFTQNYATCGVCSPTRASILTGKYPVKTGVTDWIKGRQENGKAESYEKMIGPATAYQLALEENTIAEYALKNNYTTFFAGKWHLGEGEKYWPNHQGFLTNKGGWGKGSPYGRVNDSTGGFYTPYKNPTLSDGPAGEYLTDRLTNECLSFLEANQQHPFFLMYSLYAVHNPLQAPKALVQKYEDKQKQMYPVHKNKFAKDETWMRHETGWKKRLVQDNPIYAAMIENMDSNIARLLQKLEALHLDENTLIIFTSDNGGLSTAEGSPTTNGPLRNGKGWLYEGGIRVPLIMYWKGKITAGSIADVPVTSADIFPTIAKAINGAYTKDTALDGEDILQLLAKPKAFANRQLFWHYPHYSNQGGRPASAIREANYKLIYNYEDGSVELYDVVKDIGERNNIAAQQKNITKKLQSLLNKWLISVHATIPQSNPSYNSINPKSE